MDTGRPENNCICLYNACLWSNYNVGSLSKLKACYNKCVKKFFGFKRTDSMTQFLFELGLPSFNTVLINSRIVFTRSWFVCQNSAVLISCSSHTWLTVVT